MTDSILALLDEIPAVERMLVDSRLGLVTSVVRHQASLPIPSSWVTWSAHNGDSRAFADWQCERYGFGAALGDSDRARRAAVGEAIERYCGNAIPARLPIASYAQLTRAGRAALDPATFALYSARQYGTAGFPFVAFDADLPVAWVSGSDLHTGEEVLVPASMAYLNYYQRAHAGEPPVHALLYGGIATGENRAHAERFALEELFERDANTIWWASGAPGEMVSDADVVLERFGFGVEEDTGRRIRVLRIPSQFPVAVLAVFIEETVDALISYGTACRATPAEAVKKALVEAVALLELTAEVADERSAHWQAIARGDIPQLSFRPFRADRRYLDDFRSDFHDLVDLPAVAQLYLDPRMQGAVLDRLRRSSRAVSLASIPMRDSATARDSYLAMLGEGGLRAVSVDVTTEDVRAAGLSVVRVVVPGLYNNPPPAFPFRGGDRLYTLPHQLGLATRQLTEDDLYPYPIPHV